MLGVSNAVLFPVALISSER